LSQMEMIFTEPQTESQEEHRAALIAKAALRGFRVAEPWEVEFLSRGDLFRASRNGVVHGPVFVRSDVLARGEVVSHA